MQVSCTVLFVTELVDSSIDWAAVESWLAARGVADGKVTGIEQIGGGTQNLMFKFQCGDAHLVLRRGPWHLRPHTNDALRREARVLSALAGTGVPIPRLVAAEPDESVLGSVFYLMEPVDGFNASVALPLLHESNPDIRRAMGFEAVDALVALGAINAERVGLGDLGKPEGFLERQVPQWLGTLDKYAALDGYPGHQLPHVDDIATCRPEPKSWRTTRRPHRDPSTTQRGTRCSRRSSSPSCSKAPMRGRTPARHPRRLATCCTPLPSDYSTTQRFSSRENSEVADVDLSGKVALISGGSRGLGREMVLAFAEHGADVIIASRKLDNCEKLANEVSERFGRRALPVAANVGVWDQCDALTEAAYAEFGTVDILVNNAGMSPLYPSVDQVTEALYDKVFSTNLKGPFRLSAMIGTRMAAGHGGTILNISSVASIRPNATILPYAAAKAGLNSLTEGLAQTFAPKVRVNAIMCGTFSTDIAKAWSTEFIDAIGAQTALGRIGDPNEIVGAALYFASDESSYTTGSILRVDGGMK